MYNGDMVHEWRCRSHECVPLWSAPGHRYYTSAPSATKSSKSASIYTCNYGFHVVCLKAYHTPVNEDAEVWSPWICAEEPFSFSFILIYKKMWLFEWHLSPFEDLWLENLPNSIKLLTWKTIVSKQIVLIYNNKSHNSSNHRGHKTIISRKNKKTCINEISKNRNRFTPIFR